MLLFRTLCVANYLLKTLDRIKTPGIRALSLIALILIGCTESDNLTYRYQDYQERVAHVLDINLATPRRLPTIQYPAKRERLLPIANFEQGILEVWDFQRCGLMPLINQRNSNLGRVMLPSQRYPYENHFWQKLHPCFLNRNQWLKEDPDFVQRLEASYQHKQQIQPRVFHQLLFAGDELFRQLSLNQASFSINARPEYKTIESTLNYLARLQAAPFSQTVKSEELEQHLQSLYRQPIVLSLLKSLQVSTYYLNQTA